jgi:hypothetical protein
MKHGNVPGTVWVFVRVVDDYPNTKSCLFSPSFSLLVVFAFSLSIR